MGKSSILLVAALAMTVGIYTMVMNRNASDATLSYTSYYTRVTAHNANQSALQLGLRKLADSASWRTGYPKITIGGTDVKLTVDTTTFNGKSSVRLIAKSAYYADTSNTKKDTLTSTVIVRVTLVPPGIHAAFTAFGPLDNTISDMY